MCVRETCALQILGSRLLDRSGNPQPWAALGTSWRGTSSASNTLHVCVCGQGGDKPVPNLLPALLPVSKPWRGKHFAFAVGEVLHSEWQHLPGSRGEAPIPGSGKGLLIWCFSMSFYILTSFISRQLEPIPWILDSKIQFCLYFNDGNSAFEINIWTILQSKKEPSSEEEDPQKNMSKTPQRKKKVN